MAFKKWLMAAFCVAGAALGSISGCGGSRNGSDPDAPTDFTLGSGDVNAQWSSSSTELVHDLSRHALYYADVENQDIVAIDVASGDDSTLVSLLIAPSKLRLTADSKDLYVLESDDSADNTDGFPDLIRYNISGNFVDNSFLELNADLRVDDFVATNNQRIIVAGYKSATSTVYTSLFLASGSVLNEATFSGTGFVVQQLALANDQQTLLSSLVRNSNSTLNTINIAASNVNVTSSSDLTLAQTAINTYEPDGDRVFRSNGAVLDGNKTIDLGSSYESIDFDLVDDRVVILVRGSSGFIIRYFDIDSLELKSEQTLPTVAAAAGMEPVKLFVDDGDLYVVYREVTSAATRDYLLVEFNYPR